MEVLESRNATTEIMIQSMKAPFPEQLQEAKEAWKIDPEALHSTSRFLSENQELPAQEAIHSLR